MILDQSILDSAQSGSGHRGAVPRPPLSLERTRALVGVDTVISELVSYNEDEVLALIFDEWVLGPAWNIARRGATKRVLRVLMRCVRHFKTTGSRAQREFSTAQIVSLVLPEHAKPFFTGPELQQALNCKSSHIINLLAEGSLQKMPGTDWRPGRGGSPTITRDSVIAFLTERQEI